MQPKLVIEFLRMFLGEKQPGTVDFNAPSRARDRSGQPVRPLHVKEDIADAPHDQRWSLEDFQFRLSADGLLVVESKNKAFNVIDFLIGIGLFFCQITMYLLGTSSASSAGAFGAAARSKASNCCLRARPQR